MTIKAVCVSTLLSAALVAAGAASAKDEKVHDPVGFGAGQAIPATLTLNYSETGRDARLNPIYTNYRPKVVFNGREVVCMMRFVPGVKTIAPGESGDVRLDCKEPVAVARAGTRLTVREGRKDVGYVDVHLPPVPDPVVDQG